MTRPHNRPPFEWPTWLVLSVCYAVWLACVVGYASWGAWVIVPAVVCVALHSSLQHEALHGHPTRSAGLNEALVYPPIGLFIPYRRYKDTHLRHHNDTHLTDPYDDPESFYLAEGDFAHQPRWKRVLLNWNQSVLGRWVVGPPLALCGFWADELRRLRGGESRVRTAWWHHAAGVAAVLVVLWSNGVPLLGYVLLVAWPGMSLIMTRSFIEHRAAPGVGERTAVVEAGRVMSLIYLNNNLHAVHHRDPALAWYALPARWRAERTAVLDGNGHYLLPDGYWGVLKRWFISHREPVVHPYLRKD
ncbi:MAG: fatty acid desaturase [Pseudomonadota bacterium]